jgi:hypothetical protein
VTNTMVQVSEGAFAGALANGTRVDVRSRFVGSWTRGFVVEEAVAGGYRIRRVSDNSVLPDVFSVEEIRPERRKQNMWWY